MAIEFCPFCGKQARWPEGRPVICSESCAAEASLRYTMDGMWDMCSHCQLCGARLVRGGEPGCSSAQCPDYNEFVSLACSIGLL